MGSRGSLLKQEIFAQGIEKIMVLYVAGIWGGDVSLDWRSD